MSHDFRHLASRRPRLLFSVRHKGSPCRPRSKSIGTAGALQVQYSVPNHCSSIRVYLFVDGGLVHTSGFLGWPGATGPFASLPLDTGFLDFGPVSPGTHSLAIQAEGQVGGCNSGALFQWGGTLRVVTSTAIMIAIDIKPGGEPNSVQPGGRGRVPVAILTSEAFEAAAVDPESVRFGRLGDEAPAVHSALEDVDGDGDLDLILHFLVWQTGIRCGDQAAALTGSTFAGQAIRGMDSVVTVGCS